MITVTVNGKAESIAAKMSVKQLLETVEVPANYLAVEVNGEVVPREEYPTSFVDAGDEVEVVTLVGGG